MAVFSSIAAALTGATAATAAGAGAAAGATGAAAAGAATTAAGAAGAATGLAGSAGALGTLGTLVGTGFQVKGMMDAQAAQDRMEKLRKAQMELESTRQRRQIVRQAVIARSDALSAATSQGAAAGSGLQGGYGQIGGEAGGAAVAVEDNRFLGRAMFKANRQLSRAQTMSSIGSGISSLSDALVKNQNEIGRVGTYYGY